MRNAAIICEYNPMHNGHAYHISETRRITDSDGIISLMSGNFVQRGEGALFDKYTRAKAALKGGADLVLELPALFTLQSAERYAMNAVKTLNALNCVDFLSFGAECDDILKLENIARLISDEPDEYKKIIKDELLSGVSFPTARAHSVEKLLGGDSAETLLSPNNILAIEYLKALRRTNSSIKPIAIKRLGAHHDSSDITEGTASASAIRSIIINGGIENAMAFIPEECRDIYLGSPIYDFNTMNKAVIAEICKMGTENLKEIADVSEGLENKIYKSALVANNLTELAEMVKSKRYTLSRIRRILICAYLKITKEDLNKNPEYIKILGFNAVGQSILNDAKKVASLPLAKNRNQIKGNSAAEELWDRELLYDRIFELSVKNS